MLLGKARVTAEGGGGDDEQARDLGMVLRDAKEKEKRAEEGFQRLKLEGEDIISSPSSQQTQTLAGQANPKHPYHPLGTPYFPRAL